MKVWLAKYPAPLTAALFVSALVSHSAAAHHAIVGFDRERLIEVQGVVESLFWRNPHTRIDLRTKDGELWILEGPSVNAMVRDGGVSQADFAIGEAMSFTGLPALSDERKMLFIMATRSTGQQLLLYRTYVERLGLLDAFEQTAPSAELASAARASANGIFRVWSRALAGPGRTQTRAADAPLPLTEAGFALAASWDPYDNPLLRCEPPGLPEAMVTPYPIEIIDNGDDTLTIRMEEWDNVRTIHMNAADSEQPPEASRLGYSVGHFEDGNLIVRTTHSSYPYADDRGTPQSGSSELIERFEMNADQTRLDWSASYSDPVYLTEPITMPIVHFEWVPGDQIQPYECTRLPQ